MTIKKANPTKFGIRYCDYCKNKTESQWHNFWKRGGANACDKHKHHLIDEPEAEESEGERMAKDSYGGSNWGL